LGKFSAGLLAGGALGAIGLVLAISDKKTRKKMLRDGKRTMRKANSFFE